MVNFIDRYDAGKQLAEALRQYKGNKDTIILAIPRGALQMGKVLHDELGLPLDIIITKKIPHPMSEEYAIGAVGPDGLYFVNEEAAGGIDPAYIVSKVAEISKRIDERYKMYMRDTKPLRIEGRTVIIVDDGIATGSTMKAAVEIARRKKAAKVIVAVPVAPPDAAGAIERISDSLVCLSIEPLFFAIGQFYENFPQVEDEEAIGILKACAEKQGESGQGTGKGNR